MTCFWDAILSKLPRNSIVKYLGDFDNTTTFIALLKDRAARTTIDDVTWNSTLIPAREIIEHSEWIRDYNACSISHGHDTSVCDPFLVLICHVFLYDIDHDYCGNTIQYRNVNNRDGKKLFFASDRGHMW